MAFTDDITQGTLQGGIDLATAAQPTLEKALGRFNSISRPEISKATQGARLDAAKKYAYNFIQYPDDLGQGLRHPYFMTFYINQQDLSHFRTKPAVDKSGRTIRSTVATNQASTRTLLRNIGDNVGFGRKTSRTTTGIRLFMPDTLSWGYTNAFKNVNISGLQVGGWNLSRVAQGLTAFPKAAASALEGYQNGGIAGVMASLGKNRGATGPLAEAAGEFLFGSGGDALAASALGLAVNPQVDVIYESPELRAFTFDFLFAPRTSNEADAVAEIVKTFKFHAAPELYGQDSGVGRYFVPPSEFDIEFSVDTMGKISTCVLQNITLDYAPSGAAFYSNDAPVYTRMTLQFKELEFITKELIRERDY